MSNGQRGRLPGFNYNYAYAGGAITTGAWHQISASLGSNLAAVNIADDSGSLLELGYGPAGAEIRAMLIPANGTKGPVPCLLNKGMRLAVRAVDADTGTAGNFVLQGLL